MKMFWLNSYVIKEIVSTNPVEELIQENNTKKNIYNIWWIKK